jgi:hypothetical protein
MSMLDEKWNDGYEEHRKNGVKENDKKTERDLKGEDFVWKPGLEGLEYLTILLLPIFFTRQYLDGDGRMPVQQLKEKTQ